MKKVLIFIAGIIILVVGLDWLTGKVLNSYVRNHRLPGDCYSIDYTLKDLDSEIVIIGNSHVLNSLMPSVLSDTLGMSVYNSASNGQDLPFFHTMLRGILRRYTPKAVFIGVNETVFASEGIGERYNMLAPYYGLGYPMVDSCLTSRSRVDKIMMHSTFYRFNTVWWRILLYHVVDKGHQPDGFIAKPTPPLPPARRTLTKDIPIVPARLKEFEEMLGECKAKGVKVVVFVTPEYADNRTPRTIVSRIRETVAEYDNAIFIDDYAAPLFQAHPDYFYDSDHLNADGALVYSKMKASQIKQFIKLPEKK